MSNEETVTPAVLNFDSLEPREFTLDERRVYEAVIAKHEIEQLGKGLVEAKLAVDNPAPDTEIGVFERVVETINKALGVELSEGRWSSPERQKLTVELKEAEAELHALRTARDKRLLNANASLDQQTADLMELQDNANIEVLHGILTQRGHDLPALTEWLTTANTADYDLAAELVQFGVRSFPLNRAGRRLAARRKPSRALN